VIGEATHIGSALPQQLSPQSQENVLTGRISTTVQIVDESLDLGHFNGLEVAQEVDMKASRVSSDRRSPVRERVVKIEQHGFSHIVNS
jgi:hypothetical protein